MNNNAIKPQKRHNALVMFSREHHHALLLVWKIREGIKNNVEPERVCNYVLHFFESDLRSHFYEEENTLFLKLNSADILKQQAVAEHELIYNLIDKLKKGTKYYSLLNEFADTLEKHIRFEERTLFNHIQELLSDSELNKIIQNHSNKKINSDSNWTDYFWVKE